MILRRDAGLRLLSPALRYPGPPADGGRALRGAADAPGTATAAGRRRVVQKPLGNASQSSQPYHPLSSPPPDAQTQDLILRTACVKRGQTLAAKEASERSSG